MSNNIKRKRTLSRQKENLHKIYRETKYIDFDKLESISADFHTAYIEVISKNRQPRKRPSLDYYDNRRDRHPDDSLAAYEGTFGQYQENN